MRGNILFISTLALGGPHFSVTHVRLDKGRERCRLLPGNWVPGVISPRELVSLEAIRSSPFFVLAQLALCHSHSTLPSPFGFAELASKKVGLDSWTLQVVPMYDLHFFIYQKSNFVLAELAVWELASPPSTRRVDCSFPRGS